VVVNATKPIERTLYTAHPAMFRKAPIEFCLLVITIPIGIGLLGLVVWWLKSLGTTLTVTDQRSILRTGLLSRSTTEVFHMDIRNVQLRQSLFQRLFDVGYIGISSAGQAGVELEVYGIPGPYKLKEQLHQLRRA
jgi:uncharacterized membrane protein YdbT with pleckstrin-like domain